MRFPCCKRPAWMSWTLTVCTVRPVVALTSAAETPLLKKKDEEERRGKGVKCERTGQGRPNLAAPSCHKVGSSRMPANATCVTDGVSARENDVSVRIIK